MKIKLKTKEELVKTGWVKCVDYYVKNGVYIGDRKFRYLGKSFNIVDVDKPRVEIQVSKDKMVRFTFEAFKDPSVIKEWLDGVNTKKFKLRKTKTSAEAKHLPSGKFHFDCDFDEMHRSDLLPVLKWVAGRLGYKLVKN